MVCDLGVCIQEWAQWEKQSFSAVALVPPELSLESQNLHASRAVSENSHAHFTEANELVSSYIDSTSLPAPLLQSDPGR